MKKKAEAKKAVFYGNVEGDPTLPEARQFILQKLGLFLKETKKKPTVIKAHKKKLHK